MRNAAFILAVLVGALAFADGREKYVRADAVEWNLPKDRSSVETARLKVLRELDSLRGALGQKEER